MSSILYGNLRVELLDDAGARVNRLTLRQPPPAFTPRQGMAEERSPGRLLGRGAELEQVHRAVEAQRPIEFDSTCGYGKFKRSAPYRCERGKRWHHAFVRLSAGRSRRPGRLAWAPC